MQVKATQKSNFSSEIKQATDAWALAVHYFVTHLSKHVYDQNMCSWTYYNVIMWANISKAALFKLFKDFALTMDKNTWYQSASGV